ncbi:MAG: YIP1 family protein [Nanoarchaeota archaeon]|nr:YIP1 family protein [Nanoarchaeota archaeon]
MNLKNDLNLAFKPRNLSTIMEANFKTGLKFMSTYMVIWLIIHVVLALVNGLIDGKALGSTFLFSFLTGLSIAILAVVGLLVMGVVATWSSKLFKGTGDMQKTLGLVSYAILPIFIVGVVRDLLLFISTIGGHFLSTTFFWINAILFIITFIWLAWFVTEGVSLADTLTKKWHGFICFIIAFVVAVIINWPIRWILVKIVTAILAGVL